jgi:multicomponent Na+:H+ antiporter subunit D
MIYSAPLMGTMFLVGAMSIAGFPPMGGFIGKFLLFDAGINEGFYIPIAIALLFAVFTMFYMFRAWMKMFWGESRDTKKYGEYSSHALSPLLTVPIIILALGVIVFGVYAEPLISLALETAAQIVDPQAYIDAVLTRVVR